MFPNRKAGVLKSILCVSPFLKYLSLAILLLGALSFKISRTKNILPPSTVLPASPNPFAKVLFCHLKMEYDSVIKYYKKGDPSNKFDHFIFQPFLEKSKKANDKFLLLAYAYTKNGELMNETHPIRLTEIDKIPGFKTEGILVLGNLKLHRDTLDVLYQKNNYSNLYFHPIDYDEKKEYISYTVYTLLSKPSNKDENAEDLQKAKRAAEKRLDPCPPARCK